MHTPTSLYTVILITPVKLLVYLHLFLELYIYIFSRHLPFLLLWALMCLKNCIKILLVSVSNGKSTDRFKCLISLLLSTVWQVWSSCNLPEFCSFSRSLTPPFSRTHIPTNLRFKGFFQVNCTWTFTLSKITVASLTMKAYSASTAVFPFFLSCPKTFLDKRLSRGEGKGGWPKYELKGKIL